MMHRMGLKFNHATMTMLCDKRNFFYVENWSTCFYKGRHRFLESRIRKKLWQWSSVKCYGLLSFSNPIYILILKRQLKCFNFYISIWMHILWLKASIKRPPQTSAPFKQALPSNKHPPYTWNWWISPLWKSTHPSKKLLPLNRALTQIFNLYIFQMMKKMMMRM